MLIKVGKNSLKLSVRFLNSPEAWLWVGTGYGPIDNDDERVLKTRELMEKYYPYVPYGMWVGNKDTGGRMNSITDKNGDGFYDVDLSWWPVGVYRFNIYSGEKKESPERQDVGMRWAQIKDEKWNSEEKENMQKFIYKEENGAGYCFRILIRPNRMVEAMGDEE